MNFHVLWNPHGKLHKWMIQKWHAAFNGARHAHLILLHEKFHQIGLHIRIEQTVEPVRTAPRIPIASIRLVRGTRSSGQDPRLVLSRKSGIEIVEIKRLQIVTSADERML